MGATCEDRQRLIWQERLAHVADMFGRDQSFAGRAAMETFEREHVATVLELGAGQGRDTLHFANKHLAVCATDYSTAGLGTIKKSMNHSPLKQAITLTCLDVRAPLPFTDTSFDACYSHMLFCMALSSAHLLQLSLEVLRILKPGGIMVYSVRNRHDIHYGRGISYGDDLYENDGFIVHFFDMPTIEKLSRGFDVLSITEFEEGALPRRLYLVTLRKH